MTGGPANAPTAAPVAAPAAAPPTYAHSGCATRRKHPQHTESNKLPLLITRLRQGTSTRRSGCHGCLPPRLCYIRPSEHGPKVARCCNAKGWNKKSRRSCSCGADTLRQQRQDMHDQTVYRPRPAERRAARWDLGHMITSADWVARTFLVPSFRLGVVEARFCRASDHGNPVPFAAYIWPPAYI
jgi:hypothetical protein